MPAAAAPSTSSAAATTALPSSSIIVLDNGASHLRLWSPLLPQPLILPNFIARSKASRTTYLPSTFAKCTDLGALHLRLPFERGHIVDWPALKLVWDDAFRTFVRLIDEATVGGNAQKKKRGRLLEGLSIIITEPYFNFMDHEDAIDLVLYEEYGVDAVWRCTPAQLAVWDPVNSATPPPRNVARSAAQTAASGSSAKATTGTLVSPAAAGGTTTTALSPLNEPASTTAPKPEAAAPSTPAASRPAKKTRASRHSTAAATAISTASTSAAGVSDGAAATGRPAKRPKLTRPEVTLVLDAGYSYTHCIPVIRNVPCWSAARRLDLGGKLLTNLLKETLSFRQWDMMDETFLTNVVKERCCFVVVERGESKKAADPVLPLRFPSSRARTVETMMEKRPSEWTLAELVEYCKGGGGGGGERIRIEWKLPDYETVPTTDEELVGFIQQGPGSVEEEKRWRLLKDEGSGERDADTDGGDLTAPRRDVAADDEDSRRSRDVLIATAPSAPAEEGITNRRRRRSSSTSASSSSGSSRADKGEQTLTLTSERFVIPEALFDPSQVGLDQGGITDLISQSIDALPSSSGSEEWEGVKELMYANILLVGGCARLPGFKERVEGEVRQRAPVGVPVQVRMGERPDLSPLNGAIHLITSPPTSVEGRYLRTRLLTLDEWNAIEMDELRERWDGWSRPLPSPPPTTTDDDDGMEKDED